MNIFAKLFRQDIEAFAQVLVADLAKRCPPPDGQARQSKRFAAALEETYLRAAKFRRERRLGLLGKARLGNAFKWGLKERGYTEAFVETRTRELVLRLAQKQ